jgi:hypothetical protein
MRKILSLSLVAAFVLSGCTASKILPKSEAYKGFYKEKPVAVLIMPPINRTTSVDAKECLYATLNVPVSNAGYYVIPPFLSMEILKQESAYDAELFFDAPLTKFGEVFGADLVLFTVIHQWEKASVLGTITVEIEYLFKSVMTGETIYQRKGAITVDANNHGQSSGLGTLIAMTVAAIQTAVTDHSVVGAACNYVTLQDLPAGKYSPLHEQDAHQLAGNKDFKITVEGNAKVIRKQSAKWYSNYTKIP